MSNRCGFISLSYALLIIHFVYRYMALFHADKLPIFFQPLGIIISIIFLLMHAASWSVICQQCLAGNEEVREIISIDFLENFGANSKSLPMLAAIYYDASDYIRFRSWLGIFLLTAFSFYAMSVYIILGFKIMRKITLMQSTNKLSKNSIRLQKQLFQTLIIQTCIPIIGSFLPTVISWYAPIFGVNMEWWNMNVATVAMAAFPFIDPLAVIYLIPSYRNAILRKRGNIVDDSSHVKTRQSSRMQSYAFSS
ncbi:Serpentine Receptor, class J [Caenorhabditis elegans]|nr:Serpentine Receptor, class J [Caenorhabditis elegans]CZR14578.1 Serpentine Receptor, class J [Caenorhabditis elegans]|eukprot:NP_001309653.1 Serpentine Receptor, class J [Caenorhabditis elegans]